MAKSRYLAGGAAGAALLAFATAYTSHWEGRRYVAYRDVGNVLTVCDGHTGSDIIPGKRYTDAECDAILQKDLIAHEQRMLACAPVLYNVPDDTYVSINDWAFNVGTGAACKSTLIRKVKAGDLRGACMELSKWVYVKGRVIRGLTVRRVQGDAVNLSERALCLRGLK
ncbi:lysozyme [Mesorhizobium sp. BR1-1-9]|uniref:lysozyme n=1 Tax=Mesorhizobium sp. BR1-1-9 TaxID=2876646 RepID=UPI001CD08E62|nr:lysozyme [Mesorhizobium sp. BR1-1-9]MBZ9873067.1 lysozyme [Mesorhizobium sp. BR1-1-9]